MAANFGQTVLRNLKEDTITQVANNAPALIAGGAALVGGVVNRIPIGGPAGALAKRLLRGTVAGVAAAVTRAVASPAKPEESPIQATLRRAASGQR